MNVARLNFAHGTFEEHAAIIADVRAAARETGRRVAILADLPGPSCASVALPSSRSSWSGDASSPSRWGVHRGCNPRLTTFERLPQAVKPGDTIFLNDGLI